MDEAARTRFFSRGFRKSILFVVMVLAFFALTWLGNLQSTALQNVGPHESTITKDLQEEKNTIVQRKEQEKAT